MQGSAIEQSVATRRVLGAFVLAASATVVEAQQPANPAAVLEMPSVEVVAPAPLPGLAVPREHVPANIQAVTDEHMQRQESLNPPEFMERALPSVNVNAIQGNPFQVDVNYRGFMRRRDSGLRKGYLTVVSARTQILGFAIHSSLPAPRDRFSRPAV